MVVGEDKGCLDVRTVYMIVSLVMVQSTSTLFVVRDSYVALDKVSVRSSDPSPARDIVFLSAFAPTTNLLASSYRPVWCCCRYFHVHSSCCTNFVQGRCLLPRLSTRRSMQLLPRRMVDWGLAVVSSTSFS